MQRLEVDGAVRPLYGSLGVKGLITLREQTEREGCGGQGRVHRKQMV